MSPPAATERLFAVTICAKKKVGMDEKEYHDYISQKHAGHLKELLVKNKIVEYTMQHNTTETMKDLAVLFPNLDSVSHAPFDAFVQMVFRDKQDYINVKNDPHFRDVVNPDHANFADGPSTRMSFGWFERHVKDGQLVN